MIVMQCLSLVISNQEVIMTEEEKRKIEYHVGYFCAGNGIPFDENQSEDWKEGYQDGMATLNGD